MSVAVKSFSFQSSQSMASDLLASLSHPMEIVSMLKLKFGGIKVSKLSHPLSHSIKKPSIDFCYDALVKVSRSFASVIQQLPAGLKDAICIFYLILRGLDTIEDDMKFPNAKKLPLLRNFHKVLYQDDWKLEGVGQGEEAESYRTLLENFHHVIKVFKGLDLRFQHIISDITAQMGNGMADFALREEGYIKTVADYNLYCHYVAGLVGIGLSSLFAASGYEDERLQRETELSNSMGLFLQKVNIIRDYLEDLNDGRTWWPTEIWRKYGDSLASLKDDTTKGVKCLNELIADALSHVPDCLTYMSLLRNDAIFSFCAIPQVMAIATLAELYQNPLVFKKTIKIRKGMTCQIIAEAVDYESVSSFFNQFASVIAAKIHPDDARTQREVKRILGITKRNVPNRTLSLGLLGFAASVPVSNVIRGGTGSLSQNLLVVAFILISILVLLFGSKKEKKKNTNPYRETRVAKKAATGKLYTDVELRTELDKVFDELVQDFLVHMKENFQFSPASISRIQKLLDYNVQGGKLNRGIMVLTTAQVLCSESKAVTVDFETVKKPAQVLAWAIEILQALFLVADDIMDKSSLRRGKPCWYKLEEIQLDAVNDTLILESVIWVLLKKHLSRGKFSHVYVKIVELFQDISLRTQMGQMLDLTSQPQGRKSPELLKTFNLELYNKIVVYKTAFYSFYLPIACGMILCGYDLDNQLKEAEEVCVELGKKFQIEDDFLDCYGKPEMIGKDGTDIKDHKCTWLLVMALLRMSAEQRKLLEAHYGKEDEKSVERVKELYNELGIPKLYEEQEEASYKKIVEMINAPHVTLPPSVFMPILKKIHLRQK